MLLPINSKLLPMKLHYFLFNGGISPVQPYIPTLAKEYGYSSVVVGTVYTILPIFAMLAKPIAGAVSDRFHCQKFLFLLAILLSLVFFFVIPFVPTLPTNATGQFECGTSDSNVTLSSSNVNECWTKTLYEQAPYANSSFICQLSCQSNNDLVDQICYEWNQTTYCPSINDTQGHSIDFTARLYPHNAVRNGETISISIGNLSFDDEKTWVAPSCSQYESTSCSISCDNSIIAEAFLNPAISDSDLVTYYQFWLLVLILIMAWIGQAMTISLADTICFEVLGDRPSKFGYQRLWGSVGWGIFSWLAGFLIDRFSVGSVTKNYVPAFSMLFALLLLDFVVSFRLKVVQTKKSPNILRDVSKLFTDVRVALYMLWCIVAGMCTAIVWSFLFWYLEDLAAAEGCDADDWIKTLEGINSATQCILGEIPFFFLSGRILKKIGHINAMTLVLFAFGVRFLLYSFITNPWTSLPIELVHGLTFGLFYATMTSYASIVAPPGTETTIQGLVGSVYEGIGVSLGSFIGGIVMNWGGGRTLFRVFSIGAFACSAIHAIVQFCVNRGNILENGGATDAGKVPKGRLLHGDFEHPGSP